MIGTTDQLETIAAPVTTAPACGDCGETLSPRGECLNAGGCLIADHSATRGAARETDKHRVPAAWSAQGRTD